MWVLLLDLDRQVHGDLFYRAFTVDQVAAARRQTEFESALGSTVCILVYLRRFRLQMAASTDVDIAETLGPDAFQHFIPLAVAVDLDTRTVAMRNTLAIAIMLLQAMAIVIEMPLDRLRYERQFNPPHLIRKQRQQLILAPLRQPQLINRRQRHLGNCLLWCTAEEALTARVMPLYRRNTFGMLDTQIIHFSRHDQAMINTLIKPLLDSTLDHTEVADHALFIQAAIQYQIHRPGLTQQPALRVQVGKIHMGQVIDKKLHGHLICLVKGTILADPRRAFMTPCGPFNSYYILDALNNFQVHMRLDKYIASVTDFSRKEVKRLLHAGEISVNDQHERNPARKISETDCVSVQGMPLEAPRTRYLMLNKPEGVVCSTEDPSHPTVLALLEMARVERLHICGRLDVDTTGLVLLTDDGQWAHRVTSPNHKTGKVYRVTTADPIAPDAVDKFAAGLMLNGEKARTKPAELDILSDYEARVRLHEGRYHQVKRMFAALGNKVEALHREQIGEIILDEMLEPGEYRELTDAEVASI